MAEIKRPNYFTAQFLVDKDFNDEQAYHVTFRRRHNRVSHTIGVADGLNVGFVDSANVQIATGTAFDINGNEIVFNDPVTYALKTKANNQDVYLTVAYQDVTDPADAYPPAPVNFTRTTERPVIQDSLTVPPTDGSVIALARIHLNNTGQIQSATSIDTSVRILSSAKMAPGSITAPQISAGAVTNTQLAPGAVTGPKIAAATVTGGAGGNIAAGTVTGGSGGNLAAGTVTGGNGGNIAAGTVTGNELAANTVTGAKIGVGTVTGGSTGNIAAGTITQTEIKNGEVIGAKLAAASVDATKIVNALAAVDQSGTGTVPSGATTANLQFNVVDTHPGKHYHLLFSLRVNPNGTNNNTTLTTLGWTEKASYAGNNGVHTRSVTVTLLSGTAPVDFDWKAILLPM
jgi:hypothetical protein